jgi:hypothetical protein
VCGLRLGTGFPLSPRHLRAEAKAESSPHSGGQEAR